MVEVRTPTSVAAAIDVRAWMRRQHRKKQQWPDKDEVAQYVDKTFARLSYGERQYVLANSQPN